jgi:hypothetical protein
LSQPAEPASLPTMQPAPQAGIAAQTHAGAFDGLPAAHAAVQFATAPLSMDRAPAPIVLVPHDGNHSVVAQDAFPQGAAEPIPTHTALHPVTSAVVATGQPGKILAIAPPTASAQNARALPAVTIGVPTADPQPAPNPASPAIEATPTPSNGTSPQHAVMVVPRDFENAYASGDLARMMRLFAPGAVNNRGGIDAIRTDYDRLFHGSSTRSLRLDELKWVILPDRIVGSGAFEARIRRTTDEEPAEAVRGWIQIEAIPIDGSWKIQSLMHRNSE